MSYLCSPRRPSESSEDYYQRRLDFRDAKRRELIDEYYRQKESGRMSPDSDGVTFEEFGAEVRFHEREIRIEEGRPRPEDLPKPREWPRIEFPPDFEHKSLSEISGYKPDRSEECWSNLDMLGPYDPELVAAEASARMHTSTGSPTTAPTGPSARSGHKRKRGQDHDEHTDETTLAASKKSRTADPTSPGMGQTTPSISSRRGRSHHQQQQRKRGREEGDDVLDEERHAGRTHSAKKRRTDTLARPPVTSGSKRKRELSEDKEEAGGHATSKRRTTDRDTAGPSSGRGRRTRRGAPQVASPIAAGSEVISQPRTQVAAATAAAAAVAGAITSLSSSSSLPPSSSTRITRARRRQLAGEDANLFQLGHRGETRLQEEVGRREAPEAAAAAAADTTLAAAANRPRQQPASTRVKAGDATNTAVSSKVSAKSKTRTRTKSKATITHATAGARTAGTRRFRAT